MEDTEVKKMVQQINVAEWVLMLGGLLVMANELMFEWTELPLTEFMLYGHLILPWMVGFAAMALGIFSMKYNGGE